MSAPKRVVVVGGGVIGCSVAYHLSRLDPSIDVTVIEPVSIAAAASGKAGGFLARSWCDGDPREGLARKSYDMFPTIAKEAAKAGFDI